MRQADDQGDQAEHDAVDLRDVAIGVDPPVAL